MRNSEFINKLENGEIGVVALNSAINEMLPKEHERRRRMSFSYLNLLICESEMMVNPRMWNDHCAKIWDVKFSDIIKSSKEERAVFHESVVSQAGFHVNRNPSVCTSIANMFDTRYVVGCGVIERPFCHLAPPLGQDGETLTVYPVSRDSVFGVNQLKMDYPTDSLTNDILVFGVDATFQNKSVADSHYEHVRLSPIYDGEESDDVKYIQSQIMKIYLMEQKEILSVNSIFRHMFSTTIKAISMGVLIKEKDILQHYYMTLSDNDVKEWYWYHHQTVMMQQKSKL